MADETQSYPQIPGRVWWGTREMLKARPSLRLTEQTLASQLSVQQSAAKAYIKQLQLVGLIDENGAATETASKWRNDPTYSEAIQAILESTYPKELVDAFPPGDVDIGKVTEWFQFGGLGAGTARNKAATYALIANSSPNDGENASKSRERKPSKATSSKRENGSSRQQKNYDKGVADVNKGKSHFALPDVNLNIQIHISADATSEQIETIFSSMKKYLGS